MAVSGSFHKSIDVFLTKQEKVMVSKVITWLWLFVVYPISLLEPKFLNGYWFLQAISFTIKITSVIYVIVRFTTKLKGNNSIVKRAFLTPFTIKYFCNIRDIGLTKHVQLVYVASHSTTLRRLFK